MPFLEAGGDALPEGSYWDFAVISPTILSNKPLNFIPLARYFSKSQGFFRSKVLCLKLNGLLKLWFVKL